MKWIINVLKQSPIQIYRSAFLQILTTIEQQRHTVDNLFARNLQDKGGFSFKTWRKIIEVQRKKEKKKRETLPYAQNDHNTGSLSAVYWSSRSVRRTTWINVTAAVPNTGPKDKLDMANQLNYLPGKRIFITDAFISKSSGFSSESWMAWNLVKCTTGHQSFLSLMFLRITSCQSSLFQCKTQRS